MKRNITFIVVIGVVSAFYGCASHEPQFRISGANIMSQSDMEQLFYAERTVRFSIPGGFATVRYYPDGRQEIEWDNGKDTGRFRIENEEFCSTWERLRNGAESCLKVYKVSEDEYEFMSSDGAIVATMHLK
jgi:hypothetical protein